MTDKIKQNDGFILGKHRLVCGDATDPGDVKKAIGENKIREILTDPPYGVAYVEKGISRVKTKVQGDQLQSNAQYSDFTQAWLAPALEFMDDYNTIFIFNSDTMFPALYDGMDKAGVHYSQLIIWVKNTIVFGHKDYMIAHELIAYGWYGKHKMERSQGKSVLFHPKPARSKLHPTMKPIGLLRKLILNSTKYGETVYDPFGGSGSTLLACEHTGRKCIMVEKDPGYCDTIIKRWEMLTGKKAEKI